jgi:hypothetical protein
MMQMFALRALQAPDPMRIADVSADIYWISRRVIVPASGAVILAGVIMVVDADFWGFGDDWIVIALALFAVSFLAGVLFFEPETKRIAALSAAEGPTSAGVLARTRRLLALTRIDLVLLFVIVFDMSTKPGFGDAWLWIALLVGAALAGLLVRKGMSARIAGATAAATE